MLIDELGFAMMTGKYSLGKGFAKLLFQGKGTGLLEHIIVFSCRYSC